MSPSRRDFIKLGLCTAVGFGVSPIFPLAVRAALRKAVEAELPPVFWIQGQSCGGCTLSLLNGLEPSASDLPAIIGMRYHPLLMPSENETTVEHLLKLSKNPDSRFILVVEGAVPTGSKGRFCLFGQQEGQPVTLAEIARLLAARAAAVMAVGTCASFGGVAGIAGRHTGAKGLADFLKSVDTPAPVVNVPGCPPHPDWISGTLALLLNILEQDGFNGQENPLAGLLDNKGRPLAFYGRNTHEHCPFLPDNQTGQWSGSLSASTGCRLKLGCKGTAAACDVFERLWNHRANWCVGAALCEGCTEPGFPEGQTPFYEPASTREKQS